MGTLGQVRHAATELSIEHRAAAGMAPREAKIRSFHSPCLAPHLRCSALRE
jgi:hypothetical protein